MKREGSLPMSAVVFAAALAVGAAIAAQPSLAIACKCPLQRTYQLELVELDGDAEDTDVIRYEQERWQDGAILDAKSLYVNWKTWRLAPVEER